MLRPCARVVGIVGARQREKVFLPCFFGEALFYSLAIPTKQFQNEFEAHGIGVLDTFVRSSNIAT